MHHSVHIRQLSLGDVTQVHLLSRRVGRLRLGGEPRSPIDPDPNVCRFYGRCPKGEPRCSSEMPLLRDAGPARQVACHFA